MINDSILQTYKNIILQEEDSLIDYYEFWDYCGMKAKSGDIDALILIGDYMGYNQGRNMKPLKVYTYNLIFDIAQILPQAYFYLHIMIEQNSFVHILESSLSLTSNELEDLSKKYLMLSAESQFPWAMDTLGNFLIHGRLYTKNIQEGMYWLKKAALQNHAPAMSSLGFYYNSIHDQLKSTYWFARASLLFDKHGIEMLSLAFRDGKGVPKNKQIQTYLEQLVSPYHRLNVPNKPQGFDIEINKILNWKIDYLLYNYD